MDAKELRVALQHTGLSALGAERLARLPHVTCICKSCYSGCIDRRDGNFPCPSLDEQICDLALLRQLLRSDEVYGYTLSLDTKSKQAAFLIGFTRLLDTCFTALCQQVSAYHFKALVFEKKYQLERTNNILVYKRSRMPQHLHKPKPKNNRPKSSVRRRNISRRNQHERDFWRRRDSQAA